MSRWGATDMGGFAGMSVQVGTVKLPSWAGGQDEVVPLHAHWLLIMVPILAIFGALANGTSVGGFFLVIIASGPLLFATVLVHEMGHLIMASRCGGVPVLILLWPLGGLAVTANASSDHKDRIKISAAGPATHIPMALIWFLLLLAAQGAATLAYAESTDKSGTGWFSALFWTMVWMNIYMFCFNALVPCFPLDCSCIVMNAMALRGTPHANIAACMVYASCPIILVLLCWGLYLFIVYGQGVLTIFVALWLGYQTYNLWESLKGETLPAHPLFAAPSSSGAQPSSTTTTVKPPSTTATPAYQDPYLVRFPDACVSTLLALYVVLHHAAALG